MMRSPHLQGFQPKNPASIPPVPYFFVVVYPAFFYLGGVWILLFCEYLGTFSPGVTFWEASSSENLPTGHYLF